MISDKVSNVSFIIISFLLMSKNASSEESDKSVHLSSSRITDLGEWGEWDSCPIETYVMGMRLKIEPVQGFSFILCVLRNMYIFLQ